MSNGQTPTAANIISSLGIKGAIGKIPEGAEGSSFSGFVPYLNKDGKKKVLTAWQEKKRTTMTHPYLGEKIPLGILPYVQGA